MVQLKEGSVVVCPDKSKLGVEGETKVGTIIQMANGDCLVLDGQGFIHQAHVRELYASQE